MSFLAFSLSEECFWATKKMYICSALFPESRADGRMKREPGANPGQTRCCEPDAGKMKIPAIFSDKNTQSTTPEIRWGGKEIRKWVSQKTCKAFSEQYQLSRIRLETNSGGRDGMYAAGHIIFLEQTEYKVNVHASSNHVCGNGQRCGQERHRDRLLPHFQARRPLSGTF